MRPTQVYQLVTDTLLNMQNININIYGYMRSGKSELMKHILQYCDENNINASLFHLKKIIDYRQFVQYIKRNKSQLLQRKYPYDNFKGQKNQKKQQTQDGSLYLTKSLILIDDVDYLPIETLLLLKQVAGVIFTSVRPLDACFQLQMILPDYQHTDYFSNINQAQILNRPSHFSRIHKVVLVMTYILQYLPQKYDEQLFGDTQSKETQENSKKRGKRRELQWRKAPISVPEVRLHCNLLRLNREHKIMPLGARDARSSVSQLLGDLIEKKNGKLTCKVDKSTFLQFKNELSEIFSGVGL